MDKQIVLEVSLHGKALRRCAFDEEQVGIGTYPMADLLLDHPSISRLHARILNCESRFLLEDCGNADGTFVNGVRKRRSWLEPGDEIRIGKYCLAVDICDAVGSYENEDLLQGQALHEQPLLDDWRAPHAVAEDDGELVALNASGEHPERLATIVFE